MNVIMDTATDMEIGAIVCLMCVTLYLFTRMVEGFIGKVNNNRKGKIKW